MTITGLACSSDSDNSSGARMDGGPTGDGSGGDLGPSPRAAAIYDQSRVVEFEVAFPAGEWERLLTLMGEAHTRWVTCSLRFEGEAFPNAACRRKGNTAEWAAEKKPQFVVRFNLADKNGRFRGLRRLNFEAYDGLPAPIRDRLAMSLMRQSGVDAPRVNHARVIKDGKLLGLYMNIEVVDREFLEDHFGHADADGNLWEDGLELPTWTRSWTLTRCYARWQRRLRSRPPTTSPTARPATSTITSTHAAGSWCCRGTSI